jgi:hypothetical protein
MSSAKLRKEKNCLNCGHHVEEVYCTHCGQENIELKEDALHMISHAIADYFHFEHKFFGTLKPLLLKPGKLTVDYVAGKRASYLHPIKLYIFISIVFFITIFSNEKKHDKTPSGEVVKMLSQDTLVSNDVKEVEKVLDYLPISNRQKDSILTDVKKDIKEKGDAAIALKDKRDITINANRETVEEYEKSQLALPKNERDNFIVHYFTKKNIEFKKYPDPDQKIKEDLVKFIPKMMFILLPLFALILKLVYIRKKRYYYEHLIYSFHTHSAIFLSLIAASLLSWLSGFVYDIRWITNWLSLIYIIWYIYRSLRTFYGSTRWVTLLKFFFLAFCYSMLLTLCFFGIIAITFLMG